MFEPNFKFDLEIGDSSFLIELKGQIAEDMEIIEKCIELQALFKKKMG